MPKDQVVFLFGAGASVHAGAPVMSNFLDIAENLVRRGEVQDSKKDFTLIAEARSALQRVHSKAALDIHNLEAVFSTLEIARLLGRLPGVKEEDIDRLPDAMRRVIVRTLDATLSFHFDGNTLHASDPYKQLAQLVSQIHNEDGRATVLTFNYDVAIDQALEYTPNLRVVYGLGEPSQSSNDVALLKLHGSVNWLKCGGCEGIHPWPVRDFSAASVGTWRYWVDKGQRVKVPLEFGKRLSEWNSPHGQQNPAVPVIVPPTWAKHEGQQALKSVWRSAADALRETEYLVITGYSWPPADQFFHQLFALGTISKTILRKVVVFDVNADVEERYRQLFGGQVAASRFRFYQRPFELRHRDALGNTESWSQAVMRELEMEPASTK